MFEGIGLLEPAGIAAVPITARLEGRVGQPLRTLTFSAMAQGWFRQVAR